MNTAKKNWWQRFPLYGAAVLALAALGAWLLWPRSVIVDTDVVRRQTLEISFTEEGRTRLIDRYTIAAPLDGVIDRVNLEPGDAVREGQAIATLRPRRAGLLDAALDKELRAQLRSAEAALVAARAMHDSATAELAQARRTAKRVETLAAQSQLSAQARDEAANAVTLAQSHMEAAEANEDEARDRRAAAAARLEQQGRADAGGLILPILSPVTGVVIQRHIESEKPVGAGETLMEVGDPARLEVMVEVLTADATRLRAGGEVALSVAEDQAPLRGVIRVIEPGGFTKVSALGVEEQRVRVIVDFAEPPSGLGDGYRVDARFVVWRGENVVTVPVSALFREGANWGVYVIERGRARLRQVEIGQIGQDRAEVRAGLKADEAVIAFPGESVRDGTKVTRTR